MVDTQHLKCCGHNRPCGFDSRPRHTLENYATIGMSRTAQNRQRTRRKTSARLPVRSFSEGGNHILILGEENFLILMIYESKSGYIFDICEVCQKELNEAEKVFCDAKTEETGIFHKLCNNCLNLKYNGKYPAL